MGRREVRPFSGIALRVLAFNVLVLFAPIVGILSLGTYEKQLLDAQERSLVQQGRLLAASLEDAGPRLQAEAVRILVSLRQRSGARLRVVDSAGVLLADSSVLPAPGEEDASAPAAAAAERPAGADTVAVKTARETFLYRLASLPIRAWRKYLRPPQPPVESDEYYAGAKVLDGPEIGGALAGLYGAETRLTAGQASVTLYSAIPVLDGGRVAGAVLVSQSTWRLLSDLYVLRLDIFRLFLWSALTAVVLSLLVSATITVPVRRLRDQAHAILDPRGRLVATVTPSRARDEVGELSRSLAGITARLERHVRLLESFASDVSHEMRNPLAAIRSAVELAQRTPDPSERAQLLAMVLEDAARMERLLTGVREMSRIDSGAPGETAEAPVDAWPIAAGMVEAARARARARRVSFAAEGGPARVWVPPGRLEQVLANLVDNAESFSPPGGTVRVGVAAAAGTVTLSVCDEGPGIPPEHRERIFDRFFTWRPGEEKGTHAGLGLSIVKAIAESHGGSVRVCGSPGGRGACLEVRLPEARLPR